MRYVGCGGSLRHLHDLVEQILDVDAVARLERLCGNRFVTHPRRVQLLGRIVDMREDDFPRRLAVNADGLDALEDGLAAALEHA